MIAPPAATRSTTGDLPGDLPGDRPGQATCRTCGDSVASRRRFLQGFAAVAGAGALTTLSGTAFAQAALGSTTASGGNVLVVVSLRGGADGLSLVVPYGEGEHYTSARRTTAIPADRLIAKDGMFGLHPGFAPLLEQWTNGSLAAVHAVGLPVANRSHFAAIEAIEDADPGSPERSGWLNRLVALDGERRPAEGIHLGGAMVPGSLHGPQPVLAVSAIESMFLPGRDSPAGYARRFDSLSAAWSGRDTVDRRAARSALELSVTFEEMMADDDYPEHEARYPGGDLSDVLISSARLIRSDIGAEVITIDAGSWDVHVGAGRFDRGPTAKSVDELATNLAAFLVDLGVHRQRVTIVTISEFGRRVTENASNGFDHGWGSAMFVMGAGVRGGSYYGSWPGLDPASLVDGDLKVTRDYRSVLTEIVRSRFGADASKVFPGFKPEKIGVMQPA